MALTADVFNQIIKCLKSDGGRRFNEKRTKPRVGVHGKVDIRTSYIDDKGSRKTSVWVRDLSMEGIGFMFSRSLPTRSTLTAYFPQTDDEPLAIKYTVAYSKQVSRGVFVIGATSATVAAENPKAA